MRKTIAAAAFVVGLTLASSASAITIVWTYGCTDKTKTRTIEVSGPDQKDKSGQPQGGALSLIIDDARRSGFCTAEKIVIEGSEVKK